MNYIIDTGTPPVHYVDWPEMAGKDIRAQYQMHEMTVRDGRPLRDTFKLDTHGFAFVEPRHPSHGLHRRGGAQASLRSGNGRA